MSSSLASQPSGARQAAIEAGRVFHGYRVQGGLAARPGMDVVVEAKAPDGRLVALTVFAPELTRDKELRRRLLRLARLRASIAHPHLLPVYDIHEKGGRVVLVSQIASPWTLADRLKLGPLEPEEALRILAQVAGGLEAASAKGLVHHDLTAGAVVMGDGEPANAVLTDFGISLPPSPGCELLRATESVDYRSPEEVRGEPPRPASNVYSLSCILVQCLTGAPPFPYDRPLLTLHAHVVEPPPRISERRDDLPPDVDRVIAKGMAKDPRGRFDLPTQLIRAAAAALGVRTPAIAIPAARQGPHRQRPARRAAPPRRRLSPLRRVRPSAWVAVALFISALTGFATGNLDWSPGQATPAATSAAPAMPAAQRAVREQRAAYVESVGRTMKRLNRRRATARRQLRRARRPRDQAAAARTLASAFTDARRSLPPPAPGLADPRLSGSLREAMRGYRGLVLAARKGSHQAWKTARREALQRERRVVRTLAGLRSRYDRLERRSASSTKA